MTRGAGLAVLQDEKIFGNVPWGVAHANGREATSNLGSQARPQFVHAACGEVALEHKPLQQLEGEESEAVLAKPVQPATHPNFVDAFVLVTESIAKLHDVAWIHRPSGEPASLVV